MVKTSEPKERYQRLTTEQIYAMDQYMLRLISGEGSTDTSDYYSLKRENQDLKN